MAKQKAVMSCVHDPDSPVNNWPFKQCFSSVPPQKTPVIPVETLFFLAANCLLLFIVFYSLSIIYKAKCQPIKHISCAVSNIIVFHIISIIPLHVICMQICPSRIRDKRNILYTPPHITEKRYN